MDQAVSHWLLTTGIWVDPKPSYVRFMVDQGALLQVFL